LLASRFAVHLLAMLTRRLELPGHSFLLFGPRGTGKTTWLRHVLPDALWFDLLRTQTLLSLSRQPDSFRQQVEATPPGSWVVVDEVQRLPSLLNEVHALIADGVLTRGHGVYTGPVELKDGPLRIWPLPRFLKELTEGRILE
jgi:predicted AAA+ superfamily ATPase